MRDEGVELVRRVLILVPEAGKANTDAVGNISATKWNSLSLEQTLRLPRKKISSVRGRFDKFLWTQEISSIGQLKASHQA